MESIRKLEDTVASWYKGLPHLPVAGQKWLAENVWWLVLIGVILGVLGLLGALFAILAASALLTAIGGVPGAAVGLLVFLGGLVLIVGGAVSVLIGAVSVKPLKLMQKKGWEMLFLLLLIEVATIVLAALMKMSLIDLIWNALWAAVGGYFLFEIRSYFAVIEKAAKASHDTKKR